MPLEDSPPQPMPHEPTPTLLTQPPTRSQQTVVLPEPVPSPGQLAPSTSRWANDSNQSVNTEPSFTLITKKAGADAWTGLKIALQLLSSDVLPPVKSAVNGFLGVLDVFEASNLILCISARRSFFLSTESRPEPEGLRRASLKSPSDGLQIQGASGGAHVFQNVGSSDGHGKVGDF